VIRRAFAITVGAVLFGLALASMIDVCSGAESDPEPTFFLIDADNDTSPSIAYTAMPGYVVPDRRLHAATAALCWTLAWATVRAALAEKYEPVPGQRHVKALVTVDLTIAFAATLLAIHETAAALRRP
jgi:hypothetical protein